MHDFRAECQYAFEGLGNLFKGKEETPEEAGLVPDVIHSRLENMHCARNKETCILVT